MSSTRDRILSAARELVEHANGEPPNMSELARAVGISDRRCTCTFLIEPRYFWPSLRTSTSRKTSKPE